MKFFNAYVCSQIRNFPLYENAIFDMNSDLFTLTCFLKG